MRTHKILAAIVFIGVLSVSSFAGGEVVSFPDAGLDAAVRAAIGKPSGDIQDTDLVGVGFTNLDAMSRGITDLTGLERCTDLTTLNLGRNAISDVGVLAALVNLTTLYLYENAITDISPLAGLANLTGLEIAHNQISDISSLAELETLAILQLSFNQISDISVLASFDNLFMLSLAYNQISDLSPLSTADNIEIVELAGNGLTDISALAGLTGTTSLGLSYNAVSDLGPLAGLNTLSTLDLRHNQVSDLGPLAGLTGLTQLRVEDNAISDIGPLATMTGLERVMLSVNAISDVGPLATLTNLEWLDLAGNQIVDLAPLVLCAGLGANDTVNVAGNPLSQQALCNQIAELQGRWVLVMYDGQCGDGSSCNLFEVLRDQGTVIAAAHAVEWNLSLNYSDWDVEGWPAEPHGDSLPDLWQLRLLADAYCRASHPLHDMVVSAYEANLTALVAEKPEAAVAWTATALSLSAEMRATVCAMFGLDPAHYVVCTQPGKTLNEPFSALGDCDGDGESNLGEYAYVISNGGDIDAFMLAASMNSPFWEGNPELPVTKVAGPLLAAGAMLAAAFRRMRRNAKR